MTKSRVDELLTILQTCFSPSEEGWLWLASFVEGGHPGVVSQFEGAYEFPEATAQGLGRIINESGADGSWLALCRREGRPTEGDREMWRTLRALVTVDSLFDMVVFNSDEAWSMRAEDAASRPAAS